MESQHPQERSLSREQKIWRWKVLTSTYFAYVGYYFARKGYGVLKKPIGDEFSLEASSLAHVWSVFLITYMAGQFVNGALGRKLGPRVLLLTGMAISMGCNIAFGFANSYATLMGFMILNGLAQASGWPGVLGTAAYWLRAKERGTILGIMSTNYIVGNIGVKMLASFVWAYAGWRTAFWACSLVMGGFWLLVYLWQRNRPEEVGLSAIAEEEEKPDQPSVWRSVTMADILRVATRPMILAMGITYFSFKFLRYALDSWLPYFLASGENAVSIATAGYYSTIFDWAGLAGALVAGWLLDHFFRGRWQLLCFLLTIGMTFSYWLVLRYGGMSPLLMAALFGLVGFMIYGPDSIFPGAAAIEVAGEREAVLTSGVINGIGSIGPVVQEEVIGFLFTKYQNVHSINQLYFAVSALAAMMILALMLSRKRK